MDSAVNAALWIVCIWGDMALTVNALIGG